VGSSPRCYESNSVRLFLSLPRKIREVFRPPHFFSISQFVPFFFSCSCRGLIFRPFFDGHLLSPLSGQWESPPSHHALELGLFFCESPSSQEASTNPLPPIFTVFPLSPIGREDFSRILFEASALRCFAREHRTFFFFFLVGTPPLPHARQRTTAVSFPPGRARRYGPVDYPGPRERRWAVFFLTTIEGLNFLRVI